MQTTVFRRKTAFLLLLAAILVLAAVLFLTLRTDARANDEETPRFAPDAEVETIEISEYAASFRFPRTVSGAYVQNYRCEVRHGETLINTVYRLDCGFLFPAPATLTLPLSGLAPDTEYTVSIVPVTSWEKKGEPLVFHFSTPETPPVEPLVFSARFGEGGAATDAVTDVALTKQGDPSTVYDGTRDAYYAVFDGDDDAYEFYGIASYHSTMVHTFTFETYLCIDAKPGSDYVSPFSNQEGGGFGFEYTSDGVMNFWIKIGGDWINASTVLATGNWVHLVATFDGSVLILYRNGTEVARSAAVGTVATPAADHLSLGADSKGNNGSEKFAACKIAVASVYQVTKTADEVADLYAGLTE